MKRKMEHKHGKSHSGAAFLWGFILGAIFASLLTTKKGRTILRELVNTGMELIEDFIEQRKEHAYEKAVDERQKVMVQEEKEDVAEAAKDLDTGIETVETEIPSQASAAVQEENSTPDEIEIEEVSEEALKFAAKMEESEKPKAASAQSSSEASEPRKLGSKRRLFKGIRKTKAN